MADPKKQLLFWPGSLLTYSDTLYVPRGGQLTVGSVGLAGADKVEFEIIVTPAITPDLCKCPPAKVEMPSVASTSPLVCCGSPVQLDATHPFVIIDAPQETQLRAKLTAADDSAIWVWAVDTMTHDVSDRMRGCQCGAV